MQVGLGEALLGRGRRERHQNARPLAVDAEVLGARRRDQHFGHFGGDEAHASRVLFQPVTKALIGDVDEGDRAARVQEIGHLAPLREVQVCAGWVVTAAVQQDQIACFYALKISHHARKIDRARGVVEVAVFAHRHAEVFHDRGVVWPRRVGQPNGRVGRGHLDQLKRLTDRAGPAGGGDGGEPFARVVRAEDQAGHCLRERGITRQPGVGFGLFFIDDTLFGHLDGAHHGCQALGVFVDANAQIHLGVARVGAIGGGEAEDLVDGLGL